MQHRCVTPRPVPVDGPTRQRRSVWPAALLLALAVCPSAQAVTYFTVNGQPLPATVIVGVPVEIRLDVAKPGAQVQIQWARDMTGTGRYDPSYPIAFGGGTYTVVEGGTLDTDPDPGKLTASFTLTGLMTAGSYVVRILDASDNSTLIVPGWSVVPKPEAQAISGRVTLASGSGSAGGIPQDAVIWAYKDLQTSVASASIRRDGSYTLPVPPGTYLVFAEWFGNLRSQRQAVNLVANQQVGPIDLPLLIGQEVGGTVRDGATPMADSPVQAISATEQVFATKSFTDGSYVFVLPPGDYRVSARGASERVVVTDTPIDGVDFPLPAVGPAPTAGTIVTVAGNGIQGFGGEGRRASAARISLVDGLAVGQDGSLYLSDSTIARIRKVEAATGTITTVAGSSLVDAIRGVAPVGAGGFSGDGGPATAATFSNCQGIVLDRDGNLYVADTRNHRVRRVDARTGIITTVAGSGPTGLGNGSFAGDGGPATQARLNSPRKVALDAEGNLYIAETTFTRRVRKMDAKSGIITTVAGGGPQPVIDGAQATEVALATPLGIAVDRAGNLFIADAGLFRVLKVSPAGIVTTVAGTGKAGDSGEGGPATAAELAGPHQLAVDSAGTLFFTENSKHRVRKVSADGILSTVVGGPDRVGFAGDDGPAAAAKINNPLAVALDAQGNLYFSDFLNRRVRKVIGIAAPGLVGGQ